MEEKYQQDYSDETIVDLGFRYIDKNKLYLEIRFGCRIKEPPQNFFDGFWNNVSHPGFITYSYSLLWLINNPVPIQGLRNIPQFIEAYNKFGKTEQEIIKSLIKSKYSENRYYSSNNFLDYFFGYIKKDHHRKLGGVDCFLVYGRYYVVWEFEQKRVIIPRFNHEYGTNRRL